VVSGLAAPERISGWVVSLAIASVPM